MGEPNTGGPSSGGTDFDRLLFAPDPAPEADAVPIDSAEDSTGGSLASALSRAAAPTGYPVDVAPESEIHVFDFSERAEPERPRTSPLGWASLVFAFLAPPLGFLLSIAAYIIAKTRHGWRTWPVTLATTVSIVLSVLLVIGGLVLSYFAGEQAKVDAVYAESAAFCEAIAAQPGVLESAGFGWPSETLSVSDTIRSLRTYRDGWKDLAAIAPAGIRPDAQAIADTAGVIVTNLQNTRSVNRQANLDKIVSVTGSSRIPSYVAEYCGN
jgi:hypothetical protein